jgi:tetratricopeptide (TPR) repeat protein
VRATVLNNPALAKQAGRFAWLSLDAENARNADFLAPLAVDGYPTFLILDGATGKVAMRWAGSLTVAEVERFLDDGVRAIAASGGSPADTALARADRLTADAKETADRATGVRADPAKAALAAATYKDALAQAPEGWPARGRAVVSLLYALQQAGSLEECAAVARRDTPGLERGPSFAAAAATGLGCAVEAPDTAAWRSPAVAELEKLVIESLALENVLADDRSSGYDLLVSLRQDRGDEAGAKEMAGRWMGFLDAQGTKAASVEERAALDSHRVAAALALGDPGRAVPALLASKRDLPDDYNPPARLALLYREMKRYDDALAESRRALDLAYGARKLRIFDTRAETFARMGDNRQAKATLEEALRYALTLPEKQRPKSFLAQLEKKAAAYGS